MTYKTVLVHVESDPLRSARLSCAGALADDFGAMVIGVGAEGIPPIDVSAGSGYAAVEGQWTHLLKEQIDQNLLAAEANFHAAIGARANQWRTRWSRPTQALAEISRAADIIVTGGAVRAGVLDPFREVDTGRLVVTAGRPVLQCPPHADRLSPRSILVTWKDTREARRALTDALPLLQRADEVVVVECCPGADLGEATVRTADISEALARHGVTARAEVCTKHGSTSETLLDRADRLGADLIVAGAYGHSRLGEWAFGGVTRALLQQQRRFVLFSH